MSFNETSLTRWMVIIVVTVIATVATVSAIFMVDPIQIWTNHVEYERECRECEQRVRFWDKAAANDLAKAMLPYCGMSKSPVLPMRSRSLYQYQIFFENDVTMKNFDQGIKERFESGRIIELNVVLWPFEEYNGVKAVWKWEACTGRLLEVIVFEGDGKTKKVLWKKVPDKINEEDEKNEKNSKRIMRG